MAAVSVRFAAGDAEIVLNLAVPQAVRLMEALTRKAAEAVAAGGAARGQPRAGAVGSPAWPATRSS